MASAPDSTRSGARSGNPMVLASLLARLRAVFDSNPAAATRRRIRRRRKMSTALHGRRRGCMLPDHRFVTVRHIPGQSRRKQTRDRGKRKLAFKEILHRRRLLKVFLDFFLTQPPPTGITRPVRPGVAGVLKRKPYRCLLSYRECNPNNAL